MNRVFHECGLVNGLKVAAVCSDNIGDFDEDVLRVDFLTSNYEEMLDAVDIVYIHSHPDYRYDQVKKALLTGKHVMCESPIAKSSDQCKELFCARRRVQPCADGLAPYRVFNRLHPSSAAN